MAYDAMIAVADPTTLRGGAHASNDPGASHAYLTVGNEDSLERVTLWAQDGRKLAAALRRAAAEIELATIRGR